jgi:hypothetical protein
MLIQLCQYYVEFLYILVCTPHVGLLHQCYKKKNLEKRKQKEENNSGNETRPQE